MPSHPGKKHNSDGGSSHNSSHRPSISAMKAGAAREANNLSRHPKFARVMDEFSRGRLSSSGKSVTDRKQALAIAFSEARRIKDPAVMASDAIRRRRKKWLIKNYSRKPPAK